MELESNCSSELLKCMETDENIFAVASKMVQFHDRDKLDDAGDEYTVLGWTNKVGEGKSSKLYSHEREIFSACAGAALYRRSIFDILDTSMKTSLHIWKMWISDTGQEFMVYMCLLPQSSCISSCEWQLAGVDIMHLKSDYLQETIFMYPIKTCHGPNYS